MTTYINILTKIFQDTDLTAYINILTKICQDTIWTNNQTKIILRYCNQSEIISGYNLNHQSSRLFLINLKLFLDTILNHQSIQDYFKILQSIWNYFWIQFWTINQSKIILKFFNQSEIISGYNSEPSINPKSFQDTAVWG